MSECDHFDSIVNGTNVNSVCRICGACVVDWWKRDGQPNHVIHTDNGWLRPNQIKHLAWHRSLGERFASTERTAAMFRPLGG